MRRASIPWPGFPGLPDVADFCPMSMSGFGVASRDVGTAESRGGPAFIQFGGATAPRASPWTKAASSFGLRSEVANHSISEPAAMAMLNPRTG